MVSTAIVSDLHLCEAEKNERNLPLWKKYKTAEFFFDEQFNRFLDWIQKNAQGQVELVLNGDTFDFDSVLQIPKSPIYHVNWLEKLRGLRPESQKSRFKMECIIADHLLWFEGLRNFLKSGHRIVFISGNHDVEILIPEVQDLLRETLDPSDRHRGQIHFADWFYISEEDTLIEHGHMYDPYCVVEDPVHPFVRRYNQLEVRLPFGNLATRNILNGMGYFNPHAEGNYIMSFLEYVRFFFKYMLRSQPLLVWTWFWGSLVTLVQATIDNFAVAEKDPLRVEDKMEAIAVRSKATSRMVREMRALAVPSASRNVIQIARELWIDRVLILVVVGYLFFMLLLVLRQLFPVSFSWIFVGFLALLPFFLFYSGLIESKVAEYKRPSDRILALTSMITKVNRVVYGHTHIPLHQLFGPVEHLNCGTWSPAFADVECTKPIGSKTFVWITPKNTSRVAKLRVLNI